MKALRPLMTGVASVGLLMLAPVSAAQADQPAPSDNHGQCVSSSAKPTGAGGRSDVARNKGGCPAPASLTCVASGNATRDSVADTATVTGTGPGTAGSSLTCTTSITVTAGQTISATYDFTDGTAPCGGGVPRLYVVINGQYYNTFDDNPNTCEATTTSLVLPVGGTVTEVGLVYDRGDFGSVTYSDITIGGTRLNL